MKLAPLFAIVFCSAQAFAQTWASQDLQVTGQLGVGTTVPRARAEARMAAGDAYGLRVSSADGTTLMTLDKNGRLAIGVSSANAKVDVRGFGDNGDLGLLLRAGNSSSTVSATQIVFAYDSTGTYRHSIRSRAVASQEEYNALDFYLWNTTADPTALGQQDALSLQAVTSVSSGSVQVNPAGIGTYELEVSSGAGGLVGGGTMMRASAGTHSSRKLKTDISYFGPERELQAYEDVKALKPVSFHYKLPGGGVDPVTRRGLIFEEAPLSVRGPGKTLAVDRRVANLEMALKEVERRIAQLDNDIRVEESRRRR